MKNYARGKKHIVSSRGAGIPRGDEKKWLINELNRLAKLPPAPRLNAIYRLRTKLRTSKNLSQADRYRLLRLLNEKMKQSLTRNRKTRTKRFESRLHTRSRRQAMYSVKTETNSLVSKPAALISRERGIRSEVDSTMPTNTILPDDNINIERRIASAFDSLLSRDNATKILGGFKEAFDYKREYEWLDERKPDGLKYAIKNAISLYPDPTRYTFEVPSIHRVSETFKEDVRRTFFEVIKERDALDNFLSQLRKDPTRMTEADYETELKSALLNYYSNKEYGVSYDPVP